MPHKLLEEHQLQFIATSSAMGKDLDIICKSTALSPGVVKRVLDGEFTDLGQERRYDQHYKQALQRHHAADVKWSADMYALYPDAILAIRRGVQQQDDLKLAAELAFRIVKQCGVVVAGDKDPNALPNVNTQVNLFGTPKVQDALTEIVGSLIDIQPTMGQGLEPVEDLLKTNHVSLSEAEVVSTRVHSKEGADLEREGSATPESVEGEPVQLEEDQSEVA